MKYWPWLFYGMFFSIAATLPSQGPDRQIAGAPKVIFVREGGEGKGMSWEDATGSLQMALKTAKKGDQIWVAAGTYFPTDDGDRNAAFELANEVSIYGGFAGAELSGADRDPKRNRTILSGAIGSAAVEDNSYTIVYAESISRATIIDGFIISDGNANGSEPGPSPTSCGGAWYNLSASPTIRNCTFIRNNAREGGAVFNYAGKQGESSPSMANCRFIDNRAEVDGGAVFNHGDDGKCFPKFENCDFETNTAMYGPVMMNRAGNGFTKVTLCECKFINNESLVNGNVIYNHRTSSGICVATTRDCLFEDGYAAASSTLNEGVSTDYDPRYKKNLQPQRAEADESWCYKHDPGHCEKYGRLYTLESARQICAGKSIPTLDDWLGSLSGYYDDELDKVVGDPTGAYLGIVGDIGSGQPLDNTFLGGQFDGRTFRDLGRLGYFWTSTPRNSQEYYVIYFNADDGMVHKGWAAPDKALSCICFEGN